MLYSKDSEVETDCLHVVKLINNDNIRCQPLMPIIKDFKYLFEINKATIYTYLEKKQTTVQTFWLTKNITTIKNL